jgi:hypothetical protein
VLYADRQNKQMELQIVLGKHRVAEYHYRQQYRKLHSKKCPYSYLDNEVETIRLDILKFLTEKKQMTDGINSIDINSNRTTKQSNGNNRPRHMN